MKPIISIGMWVSLPNEVRYRIRSIFDIPRSSNTVVSDGRVESDGTTHEDFKHLTVEKMQKYLGDTSTDFHKLFDSVLAKVSDELNGKKDVISVSSDSGVSIIIDDKPKKRGRPAKVK